MLPRVNRRTSRPNPCLKPVTLTSAAHRFTVCCCPDKGVSPSCHKPEHKFQALLLKHSGKDPLKWGETSDIACARFKFENP
jgi:hypothetical protein